jgi:hypothetical protein
MAERYFAKVVKVLDKYTVVINAGSERGVRVGKVFLLVGIGEEILDPDTNEPLGKLEILRGKACVSHVQDRMATLRSSEFEKQADVREIKRIRPGNGGLAGLFGPQETITESTKPAEAAPKPLVDVRVGDLGIESSP